MKKTPNPYPLDSEMYDYFKELPPSVRITILASKAEITSLGELKQVAEHLKHSAPEEAKLSLD